MNYIYKLSHMIACLLLMIQIGTAQETHSNQIVESTSAQEIKNNQIVESISAQKGKNNQMTQSGATQEIQNERVFEGKGLYGYMNGGSDLYYEYNFKKLTVREFLIAGHKYTMEIYEMDCPKNAYGLYSIHIFKPLRVDSLVIGGFDCLSQYELQAAIGNEYISIVFTDGAPASQEAENLMSGYLKKRKDSLLSDNNMTTNSVEERNNREFSSKGFIPKEIKTLAKPFSGRLKYAGGPLALSNIDEETADKYPDIGSTYGIWIYSVPGQPDIIIKEAYR